MSFETSQVSLYTLIRGKFSSCFVSSNFLFRVCSPGLKSAAEHAYAVEFFDKTGFVMADFVWVIDERLRILSEEQRIATAVQQAMAQQTSNSSAVAMDTL